MVASYSEIFGDGSMHLSFLTNGGDIDSYILTQPQVVLLYKSLHNELVRYRERLIKEQEAQTGNKPKPAGKNPTLSSEPKDIA
jgi:hypothetical protein